ncbi:hypothetical protein LV457_09920 [Mycobacterium sp. MYCO198283]|uniref:hypothetical protein n=1 Tax=Mycobacterium sp. MYCO198283 TaxID=2883505 RepID=UPI001E394220|nr:hypothetical protein [Mycobacterium sp. MYCO198283]MCG5432603.1 hypothetical protein [Mycobacterium sp. MYCO198283]
MVGRPTGHCRAGSRRWRIGGSVAGGAAVVAMVVVGCTRIADGTPVADSSDVPIYKASVARSESIASSVESSRQAASTTAAVRSACNELLSSSATIDAVNAYVDAIEHGGDVDGAARGAVTSLTNVSDAVEDSITDALGSDLRARLHNWVDAARALRAVIERHGVGDDYNNAVDRFNATRRAAAEGCRLR